MKRTSAACAAVCMALCLASSAFAKTTTIKVLFAGLGGEAHAWMKQGPISDFEKANPGVKVVVTQCSWDDITEKIALGVASGSAWDLVETGGGGAGLLGMAGLLLPLDSYLKSWKDKSAIYSKMWERCSFKGKTYAVPIQADARGMVYNKQLLAQMGMDPKSPPQSWEAILEIAKKGTLISATKGAVTQVGWTSTYPVCSHQDYAQFYSSVGGSLMSADSTKPAFNTAAGIRAAKFMTDLYQACNPTGLKGIGSQDVGLFAAGKAVMCRGLYYTVAEARKKSKAAADNIGFFPIQRSQDSEPYTMSWLNALAISKGSKNPKLAFDFLKTLCTARNLYQLDEIFGSCSPRMDGLDLAEENKAGSVEWYRNLKHTVIFPIIPEVNCIWNLDAWLWKAWTNKTAPAQAMAGAEKDWQRLLGTWWSTGQRKKQAEAK